MGSILPGFSVHGISQARILEWAAISYSRDLPNPGTEPAALQVSGIAGRFFTTEPLGKPEAAQSLISIEILKLKNLFNVFIVSLMQKLIFFFYWSIVDLQCCVSSWYVEKWLCFSYTYNMYFTFFSI